jgi:hypothetical protein
MLERLKPIIRRLILAATCHHCLYGLLAAFYGAGCLHLIDKDAVTLAATGVYLVLAVRG